MSDKKGSSPLEQAYYGASYQQGSNAAVVAQGPAATPTSDREYARRLQHEEVRNNDDDEQSDWGGAAAWCGYL